MNWILPAGADVDVRVYVPIAIACDVLTYRKYAGECAWRPILFLTPGTLAGIAAATPFLGRAPTRFINLSVGVIALAFIGLGLARDGVARRARTRPVPWKPNVWMAIPFGFAAGITTTIAHAAGAIVLMFLLPQQLEKRTFVGTSARFFLFVNSIKVPFFVAQGLITVPTLRAGLWLLPFAPAAVLLGVWLNKRTPDRLFPWILRALLALTGGKLVIENL